MSVCPVELLIDAHLSQIFSNQDQSRCLTEQLSGDFSPESRHSFSRGLAESREVHEFVSPQTGFKEDSVFRLHTTQTSLLPVETIPNDLVSEYIKSVDQKYGFHKHLNYEIEASRQLQFSRHKRTATLTFNSKSHQKIAEVQSGQENRFSLINDRTFDQSNTLNCRKQSDRIESPAARKSDGRNATKSNVWQPENMYTLLSPNAQQVNLSPNTQQTRFSSTQKGLSVTSNSAKRVIKISRVKDKGLSSNNSPSGEGGRQVQRERESPKLTRCGYDAIETNKVCPLCQSIVLIDQISQHQNKCPVKQLYVTSEHSLVEMVTAKIAKLKDDVRKLTRQEASTEQPNKSKDQWNQLEELFLKIQWFSALEKRLKLLTNETR